MPSRHCPISNCKQHLRLFLLLQIVASLLHMWLMSWSSLCGCALMARSTYAQMRCIISGALQSSSAAAIGQVPAALIASEHGFSPCNTPFGIFEGIEVAGECV